MSTEYAAAIYKPFSFQGVGTHFAQKKTEVTNALRGAGERIPQFLDQLDVDEGIYGPSANKVLRTTLGTFKHSNWIVSDALEASLLGIVPRRTWREFIESSDLVATGILGFPTLKVLSPISDAAENLIADAAEVVATPTEIQAAAERLREVSGLSARQLGALFPVVRESYSRWVSGALTPTDENQRLILYLLPLIDDVSHRVPDVKTWLFTPVTDDLKTPYDLLQTGKFQTVRGLTASMRSNLARPSAVGPDGERSVLVTGSLGGQDLVTPDSELDDYEEFFEDE